ncbi:MAG: DUF5718 family protein [Candidatus Nanopelagicales bacterium]
MITVDAHEARSWFGFGVAGNFAGHLAQAGEAADFVSVGGDDTAPKGIFPFYVPGSSTFLGQFPVSSDAITLPVSDNPLNLQIEPEAAVLLRAAYADDGTVATLTPTAIGAFNDCSIRRPGAKKISEKKNWGPASKGLAASLLEVDHLGADGATGSLRIASFLRRGEATHAYGQDSPVLGYSYYGETLVDWIVERLVNQKGSPDTPLEDVGALLLGAGSPSTLLVGIGATRYTDFGESNFLVDGDDSVVVLYDGTLSTPDDVAAAVHDRREHDLPGASVLTQRVGTA